jgi:hypothetical protein
MQGAMFDRALPENKVEPVEGWGELKTHPFGQVPNTTFKPVAGPQWVIFAPKITGLRSLARRSKFVVRKGYTHGVKLPLR